MKQEILQERFEREKTRQEYKRMGGNLSQTPPIPFTVSPSPVHGPVHNLSNGTISSGAMAASSNNTESGIGSTSSKRVTVAERVTIASRFSNHSTQT